MMMNKVTIDSTQQSFINKKIKKVLVIQKRNTLKKESIFLFLLMGGNHERRQQSVDSIIRITSSFTMAY
ncbi:MAG: hypothetical protein LVQ75_05600, partial [Candidatus Babeliales bacterium]